MLAKKLKPEKVSYPVYVQPKFNGIRMLSYNSKLQSRDQHFWSPEVLPHIFTQLKGSPYAFDGELYRHGLSLQEINSRVAVKRLAAHDKVSSIMYYVFDLVANVSFHKRQQALAESKKRELYNPDIIHIVETHLVHTAAEADYYYKRFRDQGYEGMMYRVAMAPYGFESECGNKENRWDYLLKRKHTMDSVATIIGFKEGLNSMEGMLGAFQLQLPSGAIFTAGSGLTIQQRQLYWSMQDTLLGTTVAFSYEMLSDGGIPLKPIVDCVHADIN